jgi:two-component system sensor histidine kinase KdpD
MRAIELTTPNESANNTADTRAGRARIRKTGLQRTARSCCSLGALAVFTWLAFHLDLNLPSAGFIYLILIVLTAEYGGLLEATMTSVAAVICLDYFFEPPIFAFRVGERTDWMAFVAFEFTALVVSRLALRARAKAVEANARHEDSQRLYETARQILLLDKASKPGDFVTSSILQVFQVRAVILFDAVAAETYTSGESSPQIEERTRAAYYSNSDKFDPVTETWFLALRLGGKPFGSLALCHSKMTPMVATALASLSAIVLERSRSIDREYRAEAARQAESLRAAVLDALAHDIKSPLTVIRTASSGLLAAGGLGPEQTELVSLIDDQSAKLNDLASHLLTAARLDTIDFKPQQEPILLSSLLKTAVGSFAESGRLERIQMHIDGDELPVFGDRQLIKRALIQLLDNALKYSIPESLIDITVSATSAEVIVRVHNLGPVIASNDRERIFERFYRADDTRFGAPGTGLGLSIVKKIADAHSGRVWAESEPNNGTAFSLALPRGDQSTW